ncbi:hypothetical protein acsn021_08300 [Anaerocolumna cellulosilytica]|uniref:Stage 0 sporulation protein A homolog n=1 Tax=Anaerocolumna cellulosilytica TaxID=433286 RepID=A0A6S6R240_9FIRM|nr:helix-turn-helix domain-containing protein [Anaerocolumna cellulosilytica]MBB5194318.1 YesN/AraC family two-component response regulator [Anaerocolumna cellulosilytica]BCJ93261.1 hypothetical protein acsn021_08300 [Anaerocolumna cellulosilytica]
MYQAVIVDDEAFIVEGLKNAIDWEGYHIEIACAVTSPVLALDYLKNNQVHLLITDVSMPEMDGLSLLKQAKELLPLLSVIVLSAYDHFEYVRTSLRYGAENYLLKPLDPDELADTISQLVNHMQEREELSKTYGRAMLNFRSTFIENWVKNSLSTEDLRTRAGLLGIDLEAGHFFSVIFSSLNANSSTMSRFFDHLLSYLPGSYLGHFYFANPTCLVCVFTALDPQSLDTSVFLKDIIKASAHLRLPVFASSGNTVKHFSEVPLSYQQAAAYQFLKYTPIPIHIYEESKSLEAFLLKFQAAYETGNPDTVLQVLDTLYTGKIPAPFSATLSKAILSVLLAHLNLEPEDMILQHPDLLQLLKDFPSPGSTVTDYKGYMAEFYKYLHSLDDMIKQSMYPCVDAVIKALEKFQDKDISLKTLAHKLNVTPSYLGTIFKQQTGYYFNDYLTEARLLHAAHLIEHTDMKMKDIVERVGFSSQTYFNRSFKRFYNVSPVAFRRQKKVK